MSAYYNEIDKYAVQWLKNLIANGLIADGEVDERSIVNVRSEELKGFTQCHFFAGIGGWSIALRQAMWDDSRPVWTGSCPCQPFSVAGKGKAQADDRHLWPHWFRLIADVRPSVVFGEQVARAIAHGWIDDAFDDLEREGYETAATVLPACSVGAPHRRDRLWFVADTHHQRRNDGRDSGKERHFLHDQERDATESESARNERLAGFGSVSKNATNTNDIGCEGSISEQIQRQPDESRELERGFEEFNYGWSISSPKICGVDDGIPARTPKLRAYGNAIVPQLACEFIKSYMSCRP